MLLLQHVLLHEHDCDINKIEIFSCTIDVESSPCE